MSTAAGIEGIGARHEHDVLIAELAEGFATACARLASEPELRRELSLHASALVERCYSERVLAAALAGPGHK